VEKSKNGETHVPLLSLFIADTGRFRYGRPGQGIPLYVLGSKSPDSSERGAQANPLRTELSTSTQLHNPIPESYPYVPLYRYYCDVQRHEEVALGVTSDHRLKKQRYELCNSRLTASTLLVGAGAEDVGHSASSSSSSVPSSVPNSASGSSAGLEDSAADTLEELNRIYSSSEWQSMSHDEQATCLQRMCVVRPNYGLRERFYRANVTSC
jgi:hypothetical protein